ncbi:MAG: hypothetical protein ABI843_09690 [Dokdonella sp.]
MIIASGRAAATWTILNTNGETIVSGLSSIADGKPDTLARFKWGTNAQNLLSTFRLRGEWTPPIVPGWFGLSNIGLPAGTRVECWLRRPGDPGGTYPYQPAAWLNNQRVVAHPRGGRTVWFWFKPGATAVLGVEFRIFNDVDNVVAIPPATQFDLGEAVSPLLTTEIDVESDWQQYWIDPTTSKIEWTQSPSPTPGSPYRQLTFRLPADDDTVFYGDPASPSAIDYDELLSLIDRGQTAVYVPWYLDGSGNISSYLAHRTAMLGVTTKLPTVSHFDGPLFQSSDAVTVIEAPIPV